VEPEPPAQDLHDLLHLARDFIVNLGFEVINFQSWFYGVGLYQMRSPVARAALVDHPPRDFGPHHFIRFENHNEGPGYRVHQGAHNGWIMFIGVPLDFRNDGCIREAVNTFGDYHYWFSRDPMKCRILVYVTYSSVQLVPRDVVFRQPLIGRFTGIRRSWTAAVYVLSSEFADVIPANEDPMPMDGNPHPLPGGLVPDNNMFVLPEYPANGWNDAPQEPLHDVAQPVAPADMPEDLVDDNASEVTVAPHPTPAVPTVMVNEVPGDQPPAAILQ
jgi:hypothetical protein